MHGTGHASIDRARPEWLLLAALGFGALVVRVVGLDGGLWLDEINGLIDYIRSPFAEILTVYKGDGQHPLYALLAHGSIVLFGEHAWSMRLPAAIFGAATVPLLYVVARHLGARREALFAALLLAVAYHHVWFSQNARGYTTLTFFVLAGTYLLLRGLTAGGVRWFAGYAIVMALGAYTHITVVFPAVAHFLIAFVLALRGRVRWRDGALAFGGAAVLTVLLYAPIIDQVVWWFLYRPSNFEGISTPAWALAEAIRVLQRGLVGGTGVIVGMAALAGGGAIFAAGALDYARRAPLALALFTLPALTTLAGAFLARGTMYPRFFFFLMPYAVLLVMRGVMVVGAWLGRLLGDPGNVERRGLVAASIMAGIAILVSALSLGYNYRYPKQDFAGALDYVESNRAPGEAVLVAGATTGPYHRYYGRAWPEVATVAELDSLASGASTWLLYTFPRYIEATTPDLMDRIDAACEERTVFPGTVGGGDIVVCRMRKEPHRS